jgi:hypothetical protein
VCQFDCGNGCAYRLAVLRREAFVGHAKINYPFDEPDHGGNERPAKKYIQDALSDAAKVEFVNAKAAKKECKKASSDPIATARSRWTKSTRGRHLPDTAPGTNLGLGTYDRTAVSAILFVLAASHTIVHNSPNQLVRRACPWRIRKFSHKRSGAGSLVSCRQHATVRIDDSPAHTRRPAALIQNV